MKPDPKIWESGDSNSLEPLVPKPHEFPLNDSDSDSQKLENWNRNHLIPFADETTDRGTNLLFQNANTNVARF